MPVVRPISDLQTNLAEIARAAQDTAEPVFFTEKDYGDFVFMSKDVWEDRNFECEIYEKLKESCAESLSPNGKRLTEEEVFEPLLKKIDKYEAAQKAKTAELQKV
jgi:PHD/YefM family antitoxin component YafN of YafNO toxin-antitoxin module